MSIHSETWEDVEHMVFGSASPPWRGADTERCDPQVALDVPFDNGYGGTEGRTFTVWTHTRVYFPTEYNGAEGVASVPRNPCDEPTRHV